MSIGEIPTRMAPSCVALAARGDLRERVRTAFEILSECVLCGRQCRVDRTRSSRGAACRTGVLARVGDVRVSGDVEPCLIGEGGAGIVEFGFCNLRCRTCNAWEIHQRGQGPEMEPREIAARMLSLQDRGVDVLVLRRPSHVIAQVLASLEIAIAGGFSLPVVYESGGYDHPTGLALLDGVVDIYVVDAKSGNSGAARQVTRVRDYFAKNRHALLEMHRQVGDLAIEADGRARRGLLVRHTVLPNGLSNTGPVFRFIAERISRNTAIRLIGDFAPTYQASELPLLRRSLESEELRRAEALAMRHGLRRRLAGPAEPA